MSLDTSMNTLSSALDICAPVLEGEIVYLDYPVHWNVGDLLIWVGAQAFLKRHKKKCIAQYSINNMGKFARQTMENSSTLCFHGGGNFGDIWPWHQKSREDIIQRFHHKRIVILPQSVHYDDLRELDKSCDILRRHPDLHIFLRDKNSFTLLQDRGLPNLQLCPDMAHALWGRYRISEPTSSEPLYILRRDKEDKALPAHVIAAASESSDWEDLLSGWFTYVYNAGIKINMLDRQAANMLPAYFVWNSVVDILIKRAIHLFSPHKTIITNRLHAVILGTLLGKESIAFDNSYGKLSTYIDLWMKEIPNITFQPSLTGTLAGG